MSANQKTIDAYNKSVLKYISNTPYSLNPRVEKWIQRTLQNVSKNSKILELGSGDGKDADYIESLGYEVMRTDAAQGFVDYIVEKGKQARVIDAICDELPQDNDLVYANAVLVHFSRDETRTVCRKVYESLRLGGRFSFCVKEGTGEEWVDDKLSVPRYFCYWKQSEIEALVHDIGFNNLVVTKSESRRANHPLWIEIVATKPASS